MIEKLRSQWIQRLFCIGMLCLAGIAHGETGVGLSNEIETVERTISVEQSSNDDKITAKLKAILQGTDQYSDLDVQSEAGIVTIEGSASGLEYANLPTVIAKNLEGVVGVVNNVEANHTNLFSIGVLKNEIIDFVADTFKWLPMVVLAILVLSIFFIIARPLARTACRPIARLVDSKLLLVVIQRTLVLLIVVFGLYLFLKIAGLTQIAVAIISGTGLVGLVIGFAFKDIAENYISSMLISARRPFKLGDVVEISGTIGVVQKVTSRGTTLIDFDGNHVLFPNSIVYKGSIKNYTANPRMRGRIAIGIGYDADIAHAQEITYDLLIRHSAIEKDPEPQVLVSTLGSSTINLDIYFWINSEEYSLLKVSSECMRLLVDEFTKHQISMPDDAREIIFPQGVPVNQISNQQVSQASATKSARATPQSQEARDLKSETKDIHKQAIESRAPDDGDNIV